MKKLQICLGLFISTIGFAQVGHIMQGIGATNMSMGGAATAQPLSTSGALYWNPAAVSTFDGKILSVDAGIFFSSPELSSEYMGLKGTTEDEKSPSIMPALSFVYGKENSKHTFGVSMFGVSGFGVDFPAEANNPTSTTKNEDRFEVKGAPRRIMPLSSLSSSLLVVAVVEEFIQTR